MDDLRKDESGIIRVDDTALSTIVNTCMEPHVALLHQKMNGVMKLYLGFPITDTLASKIKAALEAVLEDCEIFVETWHAYSLTVHVMPWDGGHYIAQIVHDTPPS